MAYWPPCYSDDVCRSDIFPKVGRCAGRRYYRLDTGLFGLRGQRSPKRCLSDRYRGAVDGGPWFVTLVGALLRGFLQTGGRTMEGNTDGFVQLQDRQEGQPRNRSERAATD